MNNNPVIFSWNSDEEVDDLNKIMRSSDGDDDPLKLHSSSSALINQSSTSMASCSVSQPLAGDRPSSSSSVFGFWSDIVRPPPQPPPPPPAPPPLPAPPPQQSLQWEEQDQLRQVLFLQQQQLMHNFVYPLAGQSSIPFPAQLDQGEPSSHRVENAPLMNLDYHVPSKRYQVATPGISIGENKSLGDEHNKRLKSAQTAHTISEKRRREKFKGKMKALEELLPKCDKKDTASILDKAIKQIKLLKFQVQWMQEQYMSSTMRAISQSHIPTLPSPLNPAQMMDPIRGNVVGMVPYHAMLQYPVATTMIPRMQMFSVIPPSVSFNTIPSSIAMTPRVTLTPMGPPTRVVTNVPREGEAGDNDERLAPPSSQGCKRDR